MYGSKHRTTDGLYESRKDVSVYSSNKRDWNVSTHGNNDDSPHNRKFMRTQSASGSRTAPSNSSQQQQQQQQRQNGDKEKKTTKDTKKPIRVSGDWSEFRSSTGKTYYYNSKTEVSQWEKPKGWQTENSSNSRTPSNSNNDRQKKDSTQNNSSSSSTNRSRYKMEEQNSNSRPNSSRDSNGSNRNSLTEQINGHDPSNNHQQDCSNTRLPSQDDDSSRMSFSSTSSKESSSATNIAQRNQNEQNGNNPTENGTTQKSSIARPAAEICPNVEVESNSNSFSKAERDQEIQKYYRADLIQHLTDWSSTQLEKQCLKLFDDYYVYSAKISTSQIELRALRSNNRILEIKRAILMQRIVRCQQEIRERENDNFA